MLSEGHYLRHLSRLRARLQEATKNAISLFDSIGAEVFARNAQSLYLWAALPGVDDSLTLAKALLPQKINLAPGRIFNVDQSAVSPWSRFNVGAVVDPPFAKALKAGLRSLGRSGPAAPR